MMCAPDSVLDALADMVAERLRAARDNHADVVTDDAQALECPKCGHELWYHQAARSDESACVICTDDLPLGAPKCYLGVEYIAHVLIDRAVTAERKKLAQEVRYATNAAQDGAGLSVFDRLADGWEAR